MEVQTQTLVESGETEEAANAKIVGDQFVPSAPLTAAPAPYAAGTTYAKGALVTEEGHQWRSVKAGNKGNAPHLDVEQEWWVQVSIPVVPLQNPAFGGTSFTKG